MKVMAPICRWCKHYSRDTLNCTAYPNGIPEAIKLSKVDHRKTYTGDHGIVFEAIDERGAQIVRERAVILGWDKPEEKSVWLNGTPNELDQQMRDAGYEPEGGT